jgi:hypothetical protein
VRSAGPQAPVRRGAPVNRDTPSAQAAGRGAPSGGPAVERESWQRLRQRVPGTSRDSGGKGRLRPGLSESIARLPFVRGACARLHTRHQLRAIRRRQAGVTSRASEEVTSLVRALALHGVAMLRSHLACPLRPGRGVLIRSVSRRLGSVACVREDASPNEVSNECSSFCPDFQVDLDPDARKKSTRS